jgi:NitT/TauT family transport system substrate-binding protein
MRAFLSATVVTVLLQCGTAAAAERINVAVIGSMVDTPFYIARDKDFFKNEGLDVNFVSFDSGAKAIVPLATGELDIGSGALSVAFYNAMGRGVMSGSSPTRVTRPPATTTKAFLCARI